MTSRSRRVLSVWDARRHLGAGTAAYTAYAAILVVVVVVVPLARAVWIALVDPEAVAFLLLPSGPAVMVLIVTLSWAGLVMAGRFQGPAVLPPVLTFIMVGSDLPRSQVFARPFRRALLVSTIAFLAAASMCGAALVVVGVWSSLHCAQFVTAGLFVGVIAAVLWLIGQVLPSSAIALAVGLAAGGMVVLIWPGASFVSPAGWVGLAFAGATEWGPVAGLGALGILMMSVVPILLERLRAEDVLQHSIRREAAVDNAAALQLSELSALYQAKPTVGRFRRAVHAGRPTLSAFFIRDFIGATRSPGRFSAAIAGTIGAGVLLAMAFEFDSGVGVVWGTIAGLILFAAIGPLTDGIRHAAAVTSDRSLYGIGDKLLSFAHSTMPFASMTALLLISAAVTCVILDIPIIICAASVVGVGTVVITARLAGAVKGPMPLSLLAAVPTAFGDPMAIIRVGWAVDGLLIAGLAGASTGAGSSIWMLLVTAASIAVTLSVSRWRRRKY